MELIKLFDKQTRWNMMCIPLSFSVVIIPLILISSYLYPDRFINNVYSGLFVIGVISCILILGLITIRIMYYEESSQQSLESGSGK